MRLVVTHEQPDFDALASLALAQRLHPGARISIPETMPRAVRACAVLYRDVLHPVEERDLRSVRVDELVVVDTSDRTRLGRFAAAATTVPVVVYDHHPTPPAHDALPLGRGICERVGATVTLLVRELRRRDDPLPADLASLALLALHEDTGGFSYDLTTPEDHDAAAWLLRRGGTLELVRRFTRAVRSAAHIAFRAEMLHSTVVHEVAGRPVAVASFDWPEYLADVAGMTGDLLDVEHADAALLVVRMGGRTLAFARAAGARFDVAAAMREALGGGGHPGAAFARTTMERSEALDRLLSALARHARPQRRARDLMSTPVRTVSLTTTLHEASARLLRYGHNGLPVVGDETKAGPVVGVISRRDVERALQHGLGRSTVAGFMGTPAVTARVDATLDELEALAVRHGVGRVPIVEGERLVGIVTRTDLLAARHDGRALGAERVFGPDPLERILTRTASQVRALLGRVEAALPSGAKLFLVGGSVRDALLGASLSDLDLAVEGVSASELVEALRGETDGRRVAHDTFGTASFTVTGGLRVDIATAREERYDAPGALPTVERSDVRRDLARRDFTVNALAVQLVPGPAVLLDPFGGLDDLASGALRTLHPLSFAEDPTRIVRGARLAARLGLRFTPETVQQAQRALEAGHARSVSAERLRNELRLTLRDAEPRRALEVLDELGALTSMYALAFDAELLGGLDAVRRAGREVPATAYLLACLIPLSDEATDSVVRRFHLPGRRGLVAAHLRSLLAGSEPKDEVLAGLGRAGRAVLEAAGEPHATRVRAFESLSGRRRLRGRDLLELGLAPGPLVGRILDDVAKARRSGDVNGFDEERALAAQLVATLRAERQDDAS